MAPQVFEISSSIIFPRSSSFAEDGTVAIDIAPPGPRSTPRRTADLRCGPENPIYRLPQSISSGGVKIHLNQYVPIKPFKQQLNRTSSSSKIDEDNVIFEISKSSFGDSSFEYKLTNKQKEDVDGGYARGTAKFTPGWISGGTWVVEYVYKRRGQRDESRVDLRFDEGGKEDGIWKMTFPQVGVVARELPQPQGEFGENGRALEIQDGAPGVEGMTESDWRDFLMALFITKVWRDCTKTTWFGVSARSTTEAGNLRTW